jgi:predicted GNAT family N-acyltransferase
MIRYRVFGPGQGPGELYRFRYRVYVEEMARKQLYARHDEKTIVDPLDETAANVVAFDEDDVVGCVRINFLRDGAVGGYEAFYGVDGLDPARRASASICTRLMVERAHRRKYVTIEVMKRVYEYALDAGIETNYIDCNRHLVGFFGKFGYVELGRKEHPEYGDVTVMRLDLLDRERLCALGSPFADALAGRLRARALASGDTPAVLQLAK